MSEFFLYIPRGLTACFGQQGSPIFFEVQGKRAAGAADSEGRRRTASEGEAASQAVLGPAREVGKVQLRSVEKTTLTSGLCIWKESGQVAPEANKQQA